MRKLIIGGCPRSGTNALAHTLTQDGRALVTLERGLDAWKDVYSNKSDLAKAKLIYVGDKMPEKYLTNADKLYKEFPNAKFIFTNRNGYGVITSYIRRPLLKEYQPENVPEEKLIKEIKAGEVIWIRNYERLKNLPNILPKNKYLLLNYEDNCNDIAAMITTLSEFLGYDTPIKNISYKPVHLDWIEGIGFWKDILFSTVSEEFKYLINDYEDSREDL